MRRLLFVFLIIAAFFVILIPNTAIAQSASPDISSIKYEKVNMKDGFSYLVKRMGEKIALSVYSLNPQKKLNYYEKLLDIRLAELKFIVDNKDITNIEVGSQRYFSTAGQMTNYLVSKPNLQSNKKSVIDLFSKHIVIIEKLKDSYENTTAEWRFIRDDANYLKDYSSLLNK